MAKKTKKKSTKTPEASPAELALAARKEAAKQARKHAARLERTADDAERRARGKAADLEKLTEKFRARIAAAEKTLRAASERAERAKHEAEQARAAAATAAASAAAEAGEPADLTPPLPHVAAHRSESAPQDEDAPSTAGEADDPQQDVDAELPATEMTPPLPHPESPDEPSEAWTVVRLRALARERGVAGTSSKTKAQLLDALRG